MAKTNKPVFNFQNTDGADFSNLGFKHQSGMYSPAGGLEISSDISPNSNGSTQVNDNSYIILQDKAKALLELKGGNLTIKGNDVYIGSKGNFFQSIAGDAQLVNNGSYYTYVKGDHHETVGSSTTEEIEAMKKCREICYEIDKKKVEYIENGEGTDVPCPTCSMSVLTDRGQCLLDLVWKLIRLAIPNFPYPLDILQKLLDFLGTPFLTPEEVQQINGGEGCGSPGCKGGMCKSPQKDIQDANENAAKELKEKQKELNEYQKKSGSGGTKVFGPFTGDVAIFVGHPDMINQSPTVALTKHHDTIPFGFKNNEVGLIPSSKGNCKKAVYCPPLMNAGSLSLTVAEKFTIKTGSPGIETLTSGKFSIKGETVDVTSSKGELTISSNNVTTLKGKNIIIDGNDRSGDSGIKLEAENIQATGALTVTGDLDVKGAIKMDGGIYTTHITAPGERIATGPSGAAHQVQSNAQWNNPFTGMQATIYDKYDKIYKKTSRDVFNVLSLNIINGMAELKTLVEETYSTMILSLGIENMGMPSGFGTTYFAPPGLPSGPPLLVNGLAFAGPYPVTFVYTFVVPGQTFPVYNFTHNHGSPGGNHSHDYTAFQGNYVGTNNAARAIRPDPSHVPSPPKQRGTGTKPGHKNMGELCLPCIWPFGGGGPNASRRNKAYGLDPNAYNNVYRGTNFVPVTALKFNSDGSLNPPPFLDLGCDPIQDQNVSTFNILTSFNAF
jgi:hypothetical protein